MDSSLNGERAVLTPDAAGFVAHKRHVISDPMCDGRLREVDNWIGTREAWESSPFAKAFGWSVGFLSDGLVSAVRLT
jgi:hypothetical protein